jgi:hypothetical protein
VDLLQLLPSQSRPPVFLLVDNLYAVNTGTGRWTAKSNLDAVATLKSSLLTLRALTTSTVAVHCVPGHSLIYGNEIADLLAKGGADGTTCSSMPDLASEKNAFKITLKFSKKCSKNACLECSLVNEI